jgi:hypothetical protein
VRLDRFRGAWTLLGQCLDTRLDRLVLMFWAAQIILGGSWGAIRGRELLCWMLFLVLEAINKYKEKTHASLIQSGMSFSLDLSIAFSRAKGRAVARGASSRERGAQLVGEMPPSKGIVANSFSSLGLLVGLCCSSWGPASRLARLASLGSLVGLCAPAEDSLASTCRLASLGFLGGLGSGAENSEMGRARHQLSSTPLDR